MSYTTITDAEIETGEPTAQSLFQKIKDDLDDHETRITANETGASTRPPFTLGVMGLIVADFAEDGVDWLRVDQPVTLTGFRLLVHTAGASGTLTVDVEYKRGAGAWTSILSAPVDAAYTLGDYVTVNGTLSVTSLLAADLLRLNVDGAQVGMRNFKVQLEHEVA